uniref:NADH-ubiquinone oxidoreductase chain 6 n=1 Tax=Gloeochaete wittrockiana TaxID=38269 RepID=A0A096Y6S2_9EUKA|nr:NADH dehydrogenase subunit 6 [Gloeochaete wittrockiana]AIM52028.1 NADH dehydrogenase subunit 6 [Gloeochaete wittrockiana]
MHNLNLDFISSLLLTQYFFFFLFSSLAILTSIIAIAAKNPIHSVFFLILVFFNSAGLLILLGSEFLAMLFLIVYVGAIAVLFLFVVMMLNINYISFKKQTLASQNFVLPAGILIILLFLVELFSLTEQGVLVNVISIFGQNSIFNVEDFWHIAQNFFSKNLDYIALDSKHLGSELFTNAHQFGIIYTGYIYYFLISSVILLVAMIGAIMLTLHRRVGVRKQNIYKQISRDFEKAIKVL